MKKNPLTDSPAIGQAIANYRAQTDRHVRAPSTIPHFVCKACDKPRPMYGRARRPVPHLGRPQWVCAECLPLHPKAAA